MFLFEGKIRSFCISLRDSEFAKKCSINTFWATLARCAWILQAATVGIYVTRVLGPERLGKLNYSLSIIGMICILLLFQCRDVLVRHYIRTPQFHDCFFGTNLIFRMIMFGCSILVLVFFFPILPADPDIRAMILILLLQQFFLAISENFEIYFTATAQNHYEAISQLWACLFYTGFRLWAAYTNLAVYYYAWIESVILLIRGFIMLIFYLKKAHSVFYWKFDRRILKKLFRYSAPIFIASLTGTFYARIDILMLQAMCGSSDIGYYSLSARFTENIILLLALLLNVFAPVVYLSSGESEASFRKQLHRMYVLLFWISTLCVIGVLLFCGIGIKLLFGEAFLPTAAILRVFIFSLFFFGISNVLNFWVIKTNRLILGGFFNLTGLLFNIPLNYILIRQLGSIGAAWATLISAPLGLILVLSAFKDGRAELKFLLRSLLTLPSFKFNS